MTIKYLLTICAALLLWSLILCSCGEQPDEPEKISPSQALHSEDALFGDDDFVALMRAELADTAQPSGSGTLYVIPGGTGDGRAEDPFGSVAEALEVAVPGTVVCLRGGVYTESIEVDISGEPDAYITITGCPGETVIFDAASYSHPADEHFSAEQSDDERFFGPVVVHMDGVSYVRLEDIAIRSVSGQYSCAVSLGDGSDHIILSGLDISGVTVSDPGVENHCANPILLWGDTTEPISNVLICGCDIHDCATGWSECISAAGNCEYINVINNTIARTGNIGIDFSGNYGYCPDPSLDFARWCVARGNTLTDCVSEYATAYGLYSDGAQHIIFDSNTVSGCGGGVEAGAEQREPAAEYASQDIVIRGNHIFDNLENGVTVGGYEPECGNVCDVCVYDNRCENNGAELTISKADGVEVFSNSFACSRPAVPVVSMDFSDKYTKNIVFRNNTYTSGGSPGDAVFVYLGQEVSSFEGWCSLSGDAGSVCNAA